MKIDASQLFNFFGKNHKKWKYSKEIDFKSVFFDDFREIMSSRKAGLMKSVFRKTICSRVFMKKLRNFAKNPKNQKRVSFSQNSKRKYTFGHHFSALYWFRLIFIILHNIDLAGVVLTRCFILVINFTTSKKGPVSSRGGSLGSFHVSTTSQHILVYRSVNNKNPPLIRAPGQEFWKFCK